MSVVSVADLLREPPEAERWLVDGIVPCGALTLVSAAPKVGKSTAMRCLSVAVARGQPWLGRRTVQGPVLYRPEHSANDAVKRVHGLLNTGYNEVVDCDLSNYFGEIPHAELMKSLARRVSDGRMLGLIKAWLEMPVEGDDGEGGKRRTNRARRGRRGELRLGVVV